MTTARQIYDRCDLIDVDTYIQRKYADNRKMVDLFALVDPNEVANPNPHGALFRQIGATTWMKAHAAAALLDGRNVLMVARSYASAEHIATSMLDMIRTQKSIEVQTGSQIKVGLASLRWTDHTGFTTAQRGFSGVMFHDEQWKERAVRRALGPFHMTREVRYEHGKYVAYAEDNEQLMTLAQEGLRDFLVKWPDVVAVGWQFNGLTAIPFGTVPTLRGAFGAGVSPTKTLGWESKTLRLLDSKDVRLRAIRFVL